jgi:predicted RNase H-like HicB family nuclease
METAIQVSASWDDEAHVWVAKSEDIPGLITEAPTLEALMEKLAVMVPELLVLNGDVMPDGQTIPLRLILERQISIPART